MSDDAGGPTVTGPGRGHQWARTASAIVVAISAIAVALGVLTMAEESTDHTDLMNDQNELLQRQADLLQCSVDQSGIWNELMLDETRDIRDQLVRGDVWPGDYERFVDLLIAQDEVTKACTSDAYPSWRDE